MTVEKKQCSEMVSGQGPWGSFHQHRCKIRATVERDGKWYCKKHDPVARKERMEVSYAEFEAKSKREAAILNAKREAIELLRESQKSIGGDWRERRDKCLTVIDGANRPISVDNEVLA